MPILPDDARVGFVDRTSGGYEPPAPVDAPSGGAVVGAAFRKENEIGSLVERLSTAQTFEPDPNYNPFNDLDLKSSKYLDQHAGSFIGVRSKAEANSVRQRIDKEEEDAKLLQSAGVWGTLASMAAGVLSPTSLLPGGAIYKEGKLATNVARSVASVGGANAVGAGLQELGLQASQETRTFGESAMSVAGAFALGGAIGGAASRLSRPVAARLGGELAGRVAFAASTCLAQWWAEDGPFAGWFRWCALLGRRGCG